MAKFEASAELTRNFSRGQVNQPSSDSSTNSITNSLKKGFSSLGKPLSLRGGVAEEESLRRDLVDLGLQIKSTESLIKSNIPQLEITAKTDENASKLLDVLKDESDRSAILDKILDRQDLSTEEASRLITSLDKAVAAISGTNLLLETDFTEVIGKYNESLLDDRIDNDLKLRLIEEIKVLAVDSKVSSSAIEDIKNLNTDELKLDKSNVVEISRIVERVKTDLTGQKINLSLSDINKKMGSSVLSQDELSEVLLKQTKEGKSFRERFLENPELFSKGEEAKAGLLSLGLNSVGVGGLFDALGLTDALNKISFSDVKDFVGKGLEKSTNFISKSRVNPIKGGAGVDDSTVNSSPAVGKFAKSGPESELEERRARREEEATEATVGSTDELKKSIEELGDDLGDNSRSSTSMLGGFLGFKRGLGGVLSKIAGVSLLLPGVTGILSKVTTMLPGVTKLLSKIGLSGLSGGGLSDIGNKGGKASKLSKLGKFGKLGLGVAGGAVGTLAAAAAVGIGAFKGTQALSNFLAGGEEGKAKKFEDKTGTEKVGHFLTGGIGGSLFNKINKEPELVRVTPNMSTEQLKSAKSKLKSQLKDPGLDGSTRVRMLTQIKTADKFISRKESGIKPVGVFKEKLPVIGKTISSIPKPAPISRQESPSRVEVPKTITASPLNNSGDPVIRKSVIDDFGVAFYNSLAV